jgi:hypothetical protein
MRVTRWREFSALAVAPWLLVVLVACGPSGSIEDQVRERIAAMEEAGEAGKRIAFMGFVAEGFQAQQDSMSRDDFQRFMFLQMSQQRRIHAQLFPITVDVSGPNLAIARFKVLVTGGGGLIPDDGQLFNVETEWVLEDGDWLLWRADWQAITP